MTVPERLRTASDRQAVADSDEKSRLGTFGCYIAGEWIETGNAVEVRSPFNDEIVAVVHRAGPNEIEAAISKATSAFEITRKLPAWKRAEALEKISAGIVAHREEFAQTIALEAGKPIRTARIEVERAIFAFKVAAEESKRIYGEVVPLDWIPGTEGREAQVRCVPLGPIVGNSPLTFLISSHKVAPRSPQEIPSFCDLQARPQSAPSNWRKSFLSQAGRWKPSAWCPAQLRIPLRSSKMIGSNSSPLRAVPRSAGD
jgi:hypothetical protein